MEADGSGRRRFRRMLDFTRGVVVGLAARRLLRLRGRHRRPRHGGRDGHAARRRRVAPELVSGRDDDRVRRRVQAVRDPGGWWDAASARHPQARADSRLRPGRRTPSGLPMSPSRADDRYSLWTIRADGSGGRRLAQNVSEETPSWSPDGSRIAFMKGPPPRRRRVSTVRGDGSDLHQVSALAAESGPPDVLVVGRRARALRARALPRARRRRTSTPCHRRAAAAGR